jgi:hypothetical protein
MEKICDRCDHVVIASTFLQGKRRQISSCKRDQPAMRRKPTAERKVSEVHPESPQSVSEIEVLEATERWSVYRLADGTTLRLKSVVIAVFREDGHHTPDGEPVYNMKSALVTDVRAPAELTKAETAR